MLLELILIRHGETEFNLQGRLQGGQDSPLTERGRRESVLLGQSMNRFLDRVDQWWVSPQGRARETSRLMREQIQFELPLEEVHEQTHEIRCGDWEGLSRAELDPEEVRRIHSSTSIRYPGSDGESIEDVSYCHIKSQILLMANSLNLNSSFYYFLGISQ